MFLGINNMSKIKSNPKIIERAAKLNSDKVYKAMEIISEMSSNKEMISNINDMQIKIDQLIEEGRIAKDNHQHQHLSGILEQAIKIQIEPQKSHEKTIDFYLSYGNFIDVYNVMRGEGNV